MQTLVGHKNSPITFNGTTLDRIAADPEKTRAIVIKDNNKFAVAYYCFRRFSGGEHWVIWTDDEYASQFKAMIALGLARPHCRGWGIDESVRYVRQCP